MLDAVLKPETAHATNCVAEQYDAMYARSVSDPTGFWLEQAERLDWASKPTKGGDWSFDPAQIKWFEDGQLNLCYNAVDRHVEAGRGDTQAIIFEPGQLGH